MSSDRPILVVEMQNDDPVGRLGEWLVEAGAKLDVRRAHHGDTLPANLSEHAGLVVMGGSPNAYDDVRAPWLPAVRALLAHAVAAQTPTLGVCLGGQLLAAATGGRVERAPEPEYGAYLVAKRQSAATDVLFRELPITPDVIQWHVDEITALPPGAELLASSPTVEVQAFRLGRAAWGVQFHIETTPAAVRAWAVADAEELADYDVETIVRRADAAHSDIAEAWRPFARRFAEVAADPSVALSNGAAASDDPVDPTRGRTSLPMAGHSHQDSSVDPDSTAEPISDPAAIRAALAAQMQAAREPRH